MRKGRHAMGSVNKVILVGNLGRDAEVRYTPGGAAVATLNLATTETVERQGGPAAGEDRVAPHRAVGQAGRDPAAVSQKGKQIYVEGRLQTRQWDDKDGEKRYTTEIKADRIVLLGSGGGGGGGQAAGASVTQAAASRGR